MKRIGVVILLILIIWEHRVLPAFIQYLGGKQTLPA